MNAAIAPTTRRRSHAQGVRPSDDTIYERIYWAIVEHLLPPGTKLTEDSLATIFNVSRTRVRKVVQRLAHEQIITLEANRGAFVARPSIKEAREVFEARRVIESSLVRYAADGIDEAGIEQLKETVEAESLAAMSADKRSLIKLTGQFHLQVAKVRGNDTLYEFLRELVSRTSLVIAVYERAGRSACHPTEHQGLIELIKARDAQRAARAMVEHLTSIENSLELRPRDARTIDLKQVFSELSY